MPLMCLMPNFSRIECGSLLEAKALLNRLVSQLSSPPIPNDSIEKLAEKTFFFSSLVDFSLICCSPLAEAQIIVSEPKQRRPSSPPLVLSTVSTTGALTQFNTKTCSTPRQNPVNSLRNCNNNQRSSSSTRSLGGCKSYIFSSSETAGRSVGLGSQAWTMTQSINERERNSLNFLLRAILPLGTLFENQTASTQHFMRINLVPEGSLPSGERQTLLLQAISWEVTLMGMSSSVINTTTFFNDPDILLLEKINSFLQLNERPSPILSCSSTIRLAVIIRIMARINYGKHATIRTDCNYSFCQDKENMNPNSNCHPVDDIARILNMHYQLHLKNAQTIRRQAGQMQRMQAAIQSIEGRLALQTHQQNSISSISKRDSHCHQSIESFPSQSGSHPRSSSRHQSVKTASMRKQKSKSRQTSGKPSSIQHASICSSSSSPDNHAKLLQSIVERKLHIEKELKERLKDHLLPGRTITTKARRSNYITYATER